MKNTLTRARTIGVKPTSTTVTTKKDDTLLWVIGAIVLMIILLGTCWCNGNKGDGFGNTLTTGFKNTINMVGGKSNPALKELDILYFMSPKCPWCQKMSGLLNTEGVMGDLTIVDITTPEGQKVATDMGAASKGVPAFISRKTKTGTVGFKKSIDELIMSLNKKPEVVSVPVTDEMTEILSNLQVVVFVSPSCGWCSKMKNELETAGCSDSVELVDVSTPEGQQMAKELLSEMRGVPASYSRATGKQTSGFKPVVKLIEELS